MKCISAKYSVRPPGNMVRHSVIRLGWRSPDRKGHTNFSPLNFGADALRISPNREGLALSPIHLKLIHAAVHWMHRMTMGFATFRTKHCGGISFSGGPPQYQPTCNYRANNNNNIRGSRNERDLFSDALCLSLDATVSIVRRNLYKYLLCSAGTDDDVLSLAVLSCFWPIFIKLTESKRTRPWHVLCEATKRESYFGGFHSHDTMLLQCNNDDDDNVICHCLAKKENSCEKWHSIVTRDYILANKKKTNLSNKRF